MGDFLVERLGGKDWVGTSLLFNMFFSPVQDINICLEGGFSKHQLVQTYQKATCFLTERVGGCQAFIFQEIWKSFSSHTWNQILELPIKA